jgi:cbb3-type cytochrome oxidase maturation protein
MSALLLLIPVSLGLAVAFVVLCLASIRGGQFDDLESPRWRLLFDGARAAAPSRTLNESAIPPEDDR